MEKLIYISYSDLITDIKQNLNRFHPYKFDLVVGIPRSGMIPSYLVSAFLNIDCCDLDSFIENRKLQHGITRNTKGRLNYPHEAQNVLLLDDSIFSGKSLELSLNKIPNELKNKTLSGVIYATGKGRDLVDLYVKKVDGKKLFEWGLYHNNLLDRTCFDMDGVLCKECTVEENDDGEKYISFIRNAEPMFLPTGEVLAIVTNRLEKYRDETVKWLVSHDVQYKHLFMLNLPSKQERLKIDAGIEHKGKIYKSLEEASLFMESSINQSLSISKISGKPVYCVDKNVFLQPGFKDQLIHNKKNLFSQVYFQVKHKLKTLIFR